MPTIRDVAQLAEVSISTVSLTLNYPDRVSPDTRRKVNDAAKAVGYTANPIAQSLKRGRSQLIGVVVADITNPFFGKFLIEVERCAMEADYLVIVSDTAGLIANEKAILAHLSGQMVSGIILSPACPVPDNMDHIFTLSMPFVLFDQKLPDIQSDFVGTDNPLASAMLTEHLIRLGHRRISFIGGTPGLFTAQKRKQGFINTMTASQIPVDPGLLMEGNYGAEHGYAATMRLMTMGANKPTAILAASNLLALGALQACNELGIACPDEVSLAGIDDVPWSAVIRPRITVAIQPVEDIARTATRLLLKRIIAGGSAATPFEDVILAPKLLIGESTRPPIALHAKSAAT